MRFLKGSIQKVNHAEPLLGLTRLLGDSLESAAPMLRLMLLLKDFIQWSIQSVGSGLMGLLRDCLECWSFQAQLSEEAMEGIKIGSLLMFWSVQL